MVLIIKMKIAFNKTVQTNKICQKRLNVLVCCIDVFLYLDTVV